MVRAGTKGKGLRVVVNFHSLDAFVQEIEDYTSAAIRKDFVVRAEIVSVPKSEHPQATDRQIFLCAGFRTKDELKRIEILCGEEPEPRGEGGETIALRLMEQLKGFCETHNLKLREGTYELAEPQ